MKNLIRIVFIAAALALPAVAPAATLPGMSVEGTALPLTGTVAPERPDCWVNHVQVQPGSTSGASGAEGVVIGAADIGKLERTGHPGAEHRKYEPGRSPACRDAPERRPAE